MNWGRAGARSSLTKSIPPHNLHLRQRQYHHYYKINAGAYRSPTILLNNKTPCSRLLLDPRGTLADSAMPDKRTSPPNESVTYSSGSEKTQAPDLRILHYNDVYHVDPSSSEPVGGAARFMNLVQHYREAPQFKGQSELLTFFSGDAFNPSLESSVTKGTSHYMNANIFAI